MLDNWLKFWQQWMFWWLPNGDKPQDAKAEQREPQRQAPPATSDTESADVDATTTWTPAFNEAGMSATASDDLTFIKGIGPAIAKKLDGLGVKTFGDLVQANPEELATQIAKKPVTAARVREWIAEAKKHA